MLNGLIPVEERRRNASSLPLRDAKQSTFSIQLEFLDSCDFHCPGCFVKRRNTFTEKDLNDLYDLAQQFDERGFEMNEIILGPTDLFGCKNAEEILSHPKFIALFDFFNALTFPTTLQSDNAHIEKLYKLMSQNLPEHVYIETFIVFDMSKYNENNEKYIATLEENLEIIEDKANIIFAFNIHDHAFNNVSFAELSKDVNKRYNSHLKMVPSFFRSPNDMKVMANLTMWKDQMNETYKDGSNESILNNMSDEYFGGYTYFVYIYRDGELYASPFIYDYVFEQKPNVKIPRVKQKFNIDALFEWEQENIKQQFNYSARTRECESCKFLPSCVGKKVLSFMENHNIKSCFLPKEVMEFQARK